MEVYWYTSCRLKGLHDVDLVRSRPNQRGTFTLKLHLYYTASNSHHGYHYITSIANSGHCRHLRAALHNRTTRWGRRSVNASTCVEVINRWMPFERVCLCLCSGASWDSQGWSSSMTSSMQLAQECLKDPPEASEDPPAPLEGLEMFAQTIETGEWVCVPEVIPPHKTFHMNGYCSNVHMKRWQWTCS